MRVRERSATLTQSELDAVLRPREVTVQETHDGASGFVAVDGPVSEYRRTVTVTPLDDGRFRVEQRVQFNRSADIGMWDLYVGPLLAAHLGRIGPNDKAPFWYPPDRVDAHAISVLGRLSTLAFVLGYTSYLLSQTITYAAEEFGANKAAQGVALATVRADVVIALPLAFLADRRGRRWLTVNGTAAACVLSAAGALAPNLVGLTAAQVLARGCVNACIVISAVMLAEEMPAGARSWATSLAAMATAVGSAICVLALPLADLSDGAWRILYVIPLAFIPFVYRTGRGIHETRRYVVHAANRVSASKTATVMRTHRGRFALIAGSAALISLFSTPALQFQNEWLRNDRGFNGAQIAAFVTITSLPGAIGIFVGGRLAESGRRGVGAVATFFGVGLTIAQYWSYGALIYVWSTFGSIIGAAAVPALAVYGPELFPTEARGAANGGIGFASRIGSVIGLVAVGALGDRIGLPRAITYMAIGPVVLTILILVAYPETAHHTLEELNPEDEQIP
ncbi:MAG TPA: MFS transporter [Acidimicrobiales bacterium]|nr:MFS transporter [Acidimicrobiales bacterium]